MNHARNYEEMQLSKRSNKVSRLGLHVPEPQKRKEKISTIKTKNKTRTNILTNKRELFRSRSSFGVFKGKGFFP